MTPQEKLQAAKQSADARRNESASTSYQVLFDNKGKPVLPVIPKLDDVAGHCAWLTSVFNLDPKHPITGGRREGLHGPEGHVNLTRADAPPIRFEPASKINTPAKLIETLSWRMTHTDNAVHALTSEHCRQIAHVIRMLCGATSTITEAQEALAIVGTFLQGAVPAEGLHTTYGTPSQRYEAATALRRELDQITGRPVGPPRYFVDAGIVDKETGELVTERGELVISVSDLQDASRRHIGSSLPHGWLAGRMSTAGWTRIELQGYGLPGRAGRQGPHARIGAYRGHLPADADVPGNSKQTDQGVNT